MSLALGTQTGSLVNHLQSRAVIGQPEPVVGMGVTVLGWTDRRAATIFRVFKVGALTLIQTRRDRATLTSGPIHQHEQTYSYAINVRGEENVFRREKDGRWTAVVFKESTSRWVKVGGGLVIGQRDEYYDPHF